MSDILIFIGGFGSVVFAISYMAFFNWQKTEAGKALMHFVLSLVALFVLGTLSAIFGDYDLKHDFRLLVYSAVAVTVWRLVWVLWHNWRRGDKLPLNIETKPKDKE